MYNVTKRFRFAVPLLFVASAMVLTATPANSTNSGPLFTINHYWTYSVPSQITAAVALNLQDQFGESNHSALVLDRFAVPVDKNLEGIVDPMAHLSWWRLLDGTNSPFRRVIVRNQFGEQELGVFDAEYLLAPAVKNPLDAGPPDSDNVTGGDLGAIGRDHYKCYKVEGFQVDRFVTLSDQFQIAEGNALIPIYLCNPVAKNHLDNGAVFPIVKPTEHLVCYVLQVPSISGLAVFFRDQFVEAQISLGLVDLLCVPSTKEQVVQVEDRSWGKVKSTYR